MRHAQLRATALKEQPASRGVGDRGTIATSESEQCYCATRVASRQHRFAEAPRLATPGRASAGRDPARQRMTRAWPAARGHYRHRSQKVQHRGHDGRHECDAIDRCVAARPGTGRERGMTGRHQMAVALSVASLRVPAPEVPGALLRSWL